MLEFCLQLVVVMACIMLGARLGGIAIGLTCGLGLCILTFVFHLQPSSPPVNVLLIIAAVVTMAGTLHAAGGLDYMVDVAERILRKNPNHITLVAPFVTAVFTILAGTAFVCISVLPVIAEVAYEAKVRPERPLSSAVVASLLSITASPMSAATAGMLAVMAAQGVTLGQLMLVSIPAVLIGSLAAALSIYKRGAELEDDIEYKRRLEAGEIPPPKGRVVRELPPHAKLAVGMFLAAVCLIVCFGTFKGLLPSWQVNGKTVTLSIPHALEMIMLGSAAIMVVVCKIKPAKILASPVFSSGLMGMIAVFGVAWMTDSFFLEHRKFIIETFSGVIRSYPWTFAIVMAVMSALLLSQGATVPAVIPLGLTLGISPQHMVAMYAAVNGPILLPIGGVQLAGIAFDRTGTTKVGKYVLNHSYMLPGAVGITVAVLVGFCLTPLVF